MTRFADPARCPDCGAAITPGDPGCPACGLSLHGDVARDLFVTLTRADELLTTLRAASAPAAAPAAPVLATVGAGAPTPPPAAASAPPTLLPPRPTAIDRLSGASVPKILLGLGAACLLVAALVFLAVTWSVMSVGGRTATLVGLTAVAGALTAWMARRGLRAATEALGLVALGLLSLDVLGSDNAGWLGDPSPATFRIVLGALLVAVSAAAVVAVRRTPAAGFVAGEVVAGGATALLTQGVGSADLLATSPALVLAVVVAAGTALALHRARMAVATVIAAAVAGSAWLVLAGHSVLRAGDDATVGALWGRAEVWPLLAAAVLVAVPALVRGLPLTARVVAAGAGYLTLSVAVAMPALDEPATALTLALLAALAVSAGVTELARDGWRFVALGTQVLAGMAVGLVSILFLGTAVDRVSGVAGDPWVAGLGVRLPGWHDSSLPAAWLLPLCALALVGTAVVLVRTSGTGARLRGTVAAAVGVAVGSGTLVATLALYPVPLLVVVVATLLAVVALTAVGLRQEHPVWLLLALAALVPALVAALPAASLTLIVTAVALVLGTTVHLRAERQLVSDGAGLLVSVALGGTAATAAHLLDAAPAWAVLAGLVALAAVVLLAPYAPASWWRGPAAAARTSVELGAAAAALPLGTIGVLLAPEDQAATWAAVYLTLAGSTVVVMSLLREDRRELAWAGGALLALASWVRLWDIGVRDPEPYTLPAATALLVTGLVHLRRNPGSSTVTALGPGLGLGLLPSLLWALDEPASLRSLLLGLACLALVVAGARLRWTAPMAFGAAAGTLLVLRLAAPYIGDAVPRWALLGAAGAVLLVMGVTWERRLSEARHAVTYLRHLR